MREHIVKAVEQYIDRHYDKIHEHVDRNLERLKKIVVEKLPDYVLEFIRKHSDDGDGHDTMIENIFQAITAIADKLNDEYKEEIRTSTREHLDEITVNSADHLTDLVVRESKRAIREVTSEDDDGESWWKDIDLSFLKGGKEGIIKKIMEIIKSPIQHSSGNINKSISEKVPEKARVKLYRKLGAGDTEDVEIESREVHERGVSSKHKHSFTKIMNSFVGKEGGDGGVRLSFIDKIFQKIPPKIEAALTPHFKEFEEKLMEHLNIELHENIFKDENFLQGMKTLIGKFGDKDGDGKNDFLEGVSNAVESFFHIKKK